MISTGFSALDNCIGGLKKGKLYCLAGFNFTPEWIVEHFAINMIANTGRSGFVYADSWGGTNPEVWENKIFFSVGESGKIIDFLPDVNNGFRLYRDKAVKTSRVEEICGRFSALAVLTALSRYKRKPLLASGGKSIALPLSQTEKNILSPQTSGLLPSHESA